MLNPGDLVVGDSRSPVIVSVVKSIGDILGPPRHPPDGWSPRHSADNQRVTGFSARTERWSRGTRRPQAPERTDPGDRSVRMRLRPARRGGVRRLPGRAERAGPAISRDPARAPRIALIASGSSSVAINRSRTPQRGHAGRRGRRRVASARPTPSGERPAPASTRRSTWRVC